MGWRKLEGIIFAGKSSVEHGDIDVEGFGEKQVRSSVFEGSTCHSLDMGYINVVVAVVDVTFC